MILTTEKISELELERLEKKATSLLNKLYLIEFIKDFKYETIESKINILKERKKEILNQIQEKKIENENFSKK